MNAIYSWSREYLTDFCWISYHYIPLKCETESDCFSKLQRKVIFLLFALLNVIYCNYFSTTIRLNIFQNEFKIKNNMIVRTQNVVIVVQMLSAIYSCHLIKEYNEVDKRGFHRIEQKRTFDERIGKLNRV